MKKSVKRVVGARYYLLIDKVRTSFWALPSAMTILAFATARGLIALDRAVDFDATWLVSWLYGGTPEGARTLLSSLAGSMITVSGIVFSMTIVALSFASTNLGPRLLRNFIRDRGNQFVLGCFIATFLFTLQILASLRGGPDQGAIFVPRFSITVAMTFAVLSFGVLIFFVHHVSSTIQVGPIIQRVGNQLERAADRFYPWDDDGRDEARSDTDEIEELVRASEERTVVSAARSGYVQAIDRGTLASLASEWELVLVATKRPGDFVVEGASLLRATGELDDEDDLRRARKAFSIGAVRTEAEDVEYAIALLVEIAVRALSPGINDPNTAITCIDRLSASLSLLAVREMPAYDVERDDREDLRLIVPGVTFSEAMDAAWNQLRQHGADQVAVGIRILEALCRIASCARAPASIEALARHASMVARRTRKSCDEDGDRADVDERLREIEAALGRPLD